MKLSKLATKFHSNPDWTQHTTYVADNSKERRRVRREEGWIRKKRLGQGGFGTVWLEQCVQGEKNDELRAVNSTSYNRELEAIALFSHENVRTEPMIAVGRTLIVAQYQHCFVKSFGWYEDDEDIFLAMEFFSEGDLSRYLGSPFPEQEAQSIAAQILEGLQFMHRHNFAHRDLKPDVTCLPHSKHKQHH